MRKPKSGPAAQHALVRPIPLSRPRASADHRAAHAEARPSRPTARDGGRPAREGNYAREPPKHYVILASSRTLFPQSKLLQLHPPFSPPSLRRSPWPPSAYRRDGAGTGRPRRRHPTSHYSTKRLMITSEKKHDGWKCYGGQGHRPKLPPWRWPLTCKGERIPVSNNEGKASTRASEHQGVLMDTFALIVQTKVV